MTRKVGDIMARTEAFKRPTVAAWSFGKRRKGICLVCEGKGTPIVRLPEPAQVVGVPRTQES